MNGALRRGPVQETLVTEACCPAAGERSRPVRDPPRRNLTGRGSRTPRLRASRSQMPNAGGSIVFLQGAELAVLQVSTNEVLCAEFEFPVGPQDQVGPDRNPWRFSFNRFVVEPGQLYDVTVHHLPKLGTDGDPNHHSKCLLVPDCRDSRMRTTTPCVISGSLWEPDLSAERLENHSLRVTFTPWTEASARYRLLVSGFPETTNKSCHLKLHHVAPVGQPPRRLSITVPLGNVRACCRYTVQIQPFFQSCGNDCIRHTMTVPSRGPPPTLLPPPLTPPMEDHSGDVSLWVYWVITCVCVLLVGSVILTAMCMAHQKRGSGASKSRNDSVYSETPALPPLPPLKPRKVWVVYSADHPLYVDVVVRFAQFLLTACGTEVALDLLEEREISEAGALAWITRQKRAADAGASKIVVLCSRGTRAKWQAMLGRGGPAAVRLRGDRRRPAGDLFTPALNVILPDFKRPARFGGYVVCYFSDICAEEDVPEPFLITSCYPLMGAFEEVYFRIQDLEMFQPGRGHRVRGLSAAGSPGGPAGRGLEEAVRRFRDWQAAHPDWFERENGGGSDDDEEEEEMEEETIPPGGKEAIVRQKLLLREPGLAEGFRADPLLARTDAGAFRVDPRPPPGLGPAPSALRTLVAADERLPPSLAVTPVPRAAAPTGRLVPVEEEEEEGRLLSDPLPGAPAAGPPDPLAPGRLEEWVQSLLGPGDGETRTPAGEEQRRSVQSDQGYISRSSLQPPDGPEEDEEEDDGEEEDGEGEEREEPLSPAVLASLKNLQHHLLFHHLRQESGQPAPS
ncbi:interleukin-17 receptor A [Tachyglossus aculeatus]|uniref:interleukin-17 receptor A n=1 Tax=Tachyglossus aculeatus TaxID=9261 RepID=UPI0018F6A683|nr:interleukin-17 receptor A [Tachyglossus aculeatus]